MRVTDIDAVNRVFADAFTERYRRDGMVGVRVPQLNPAIWRYAIEGARAGAMVWRDPSGEVAAFNVAHRSGTEGWMGPLAVRPEWQGHGVGRSIVQAGAAYLLSEGATTVGLETMPRTVDNIGFYAGMGYVPGPLTITLTVDAADGPLETLGALGSAERDSHVEACRELVGRLIPGRDFSRELQLTQELGIGDTCVLRGPHGVRGFAVYHAVPLVEGRAREELRVLKLAVEHDDDLVPLMLMVGSAARRAGTLRAAVRVQSGYQAAWDTLIGLGARVRWTDLRMTLRGYPEIVARSGVVFSNWEI
ncbi:MAG: GNAT family N-acetyltransferase [Gemmatimonadetes bacterium]|nr:GNAT family N-acetyltransferase [Gemmatimonadota bacterium]